MGKGKGEGWLLVGLGLLIVVGAVYYSETGQGEENDSALIPNSLEGRIDFVVAALNKQFTKRWVDIGFATLKSYLEKTHPTVAALVYVVVQVEQMSKSQPMDSYTKQQTAVQIARRLRA